MTIEEFTKHLSSLPTEIHWFVQNPRFKGNQIVEAIVVFEMPYPSEDSEEEK